VAELAERAALELEADRVAGLCRLVLLFRLLALNAALFYLPERPHETTLIVGAIIVLAIESYLPLRYWTRVRGSLVAHPALLVADLVVAETVLALIGPDSPFVYVTVGTALLAGVLYGPRGAAGVTVALVGAYVAIVLVRYGGLRHDFAVIIDIPVLYPLAAAGGVAVAALLERQAATEAALRDATGAAAASEERARVAREMHDSLGKTLCGVSLAAQALAARAPQETARQASWLANAADVAAAEARALIGDLRRDMLDLPLGEAVRRHVARWALDQRIAAEVIGAEHAGGDPSSRYELLCILKEALANIERHAHATRVRVELGEDRGWLTLLVSDDGIGLSIAGDPREIEPDGHFGLIGMAERAERVGGGLQVLGEPGAGTTVLTSVPVTVERRPVPTAAAS